jgi:hypothetical protein
MACVTGKCLDRLDNQRDVSTGLDELDQLLNNHWRGKPPDAESAGAPKQDGGPSCFPKGHGHVLRTWCWALLVAKDIDA